MQQPSQTVNHAVSVLDYFRRATFLKSVEQLRDLPPDSGAEVAFIGRSNVGKSSVLNALCDHQGLARTSRTPGRTQHFVVFELAADRRLIDLPGFGYAAVNKSMRAHWDETIPLYLEERASLAGLVLIADARHPLRAEELALVRWTAEPDDRAAAGEAFARVAQSWTPLELTVPRATAVFERVPYMHMLTAGGASADEFHEA